ncbi:NADH-quinone oxidoreductase subunit H, partial [Streptomyces albidoflavus]
PQRGGAPVFAEVQLGAGERTLVKTGAVLALLLWLRRRLPGVRMDRYTELSWVVLTPLAVLQALVVAVVVLP